MNCYIVVERSNNREEFIEPIIYSILGTLTFCILVFNLKSPGKRIEHSIRPHGTLGDENTIRSIGQLLGPPLVQGNKIEILNNGDEIFDSMLEAIRHAQVSITFETFIYWKGEIGKKFADALSERARAGVKVHVLIDWVGSKKLERTFFEQLISSGVTVERYHPIRWYNLTRINNRTHRKIMVIDGKIGFTGGVGIADQWQGHAQDEDHWRDSHFRVTGPVVAQLQAAFMDNWNTANKEVLHGKEYFPELKPTGNSLSQVFKSSPQEGSSSVRLMYLYSIAHAKKSISIANAYFVPDAHMKKLLINAALRGIKIEVVVPGKYIDTAVTRRASMSNWKELLEAGIKIYEYQSTMFHCKYMVIDDLWVSVGSTNLDNRSFRLNAECNLNVIDKEHAVKMMEIFEEDKIASREIRLKDWVKRPIISKALEQLAALTKGQL